MTVPAVPDRVSRHARLMAEIEDKTRGHAVESKWRALLDSIDRDAAEHREIAYMCAMFEQSAESWEDEIEHYFRRLTIDDKLPYDRESVSPHAISPARLAGV